MSIPGCIHLLILWRTKIIAYGWHCDFSWNFYNFAIMKERIILFVVGLLSVLSLSAQGTVSAPFAYPSVPDSITDVQARYDYFVCMDENNLRGALRILGEAQQKKCVKLLSFCDSDEDVSDPWYTRDFETCYNDVLRGVQAMLRRLS